MNAAQSTPSREGSSALLEAIADACSTVAPTWPLDRFIAVNPHWGRIGHPFAMVDGRLARVAGSSLTMPLVYYQQAWESGAISIGDLRQALEEAPRPLSEEDAIAALAAGDPKRCALPLPSDLLDATRDLRHAPPWRDTITHQVSQFCAAWFDRDQADWHPARQDGLYAAWLRAITEDHSLALLMRAPHIRERARKLPGTALALITWACERLAVPGEHVQDLLEVTLLRINGWAAWCAYQRWQARLAGQDDATLVDLLATRLAWECLLDDGLRTPESTWAQWRLRWRAPPDTAQTEAAVARAIWQRAQEIAHQAPLLCALGRNLSASARTPASVQAAFCIDVRSEVLRRALEHVAPDIETLGCAGFFGLPISYTPLATQATRPQLPGLLAPALRVTDSTGHAGLDDGIASQRQARLGRVASWQPFGRLPGSAFTLVESLGMACLGKIARRSLPGDAQGVAADQLALTVGQARQLRPQLVTSGTQDAGEPAAQALRILRAMSLTQDFARLVLLVGHGSQSANNPHAAGLDCGACGGQTGEVNARVLAGMLNDVAVRASLREHALHIPATTHFLAALHNTTTDDVVIFDTDGAPASHADDLARLQAMLRAAGEQARAERAPQLGLAQLAARPKALATALRRRANDWAQTRPEWGLANNAALIIAPRARTRAINLEGRVFLHEYAHRRDTDGSVLELLMTAPMIVAHWINLQYHASTVDELRYGSGNKVLHNVVGGRIGVFEGNAGDLRIGLPRQSVHDGQRYTHAPLRLSVFIEAPQAMIAAVIARHATVWQLVDHQWLHLFQIEPGGPTLSCYRGARWEGVDCQAAQRAGTDPQKTA